MLDTDKPHIILYVDIGYVDSYFQVVRPGRKYMYLIPRYA